MEKLLCRVWLRLLVKLFPERLIYGAFRLCQESGRGEYIWNDGPYFIGVDWGSKHGDYSCAVLMRKHADGTMEVIGEKRVEVTNGSN